MSDLADSRELALSDVGDAARGIGFDDWPHLLESVRRAGHDAGQPSCHDAFRIAAHGRRQVVDAYLGQLRPNIPRLLETDGRAVDDDLGPLRSALRREPILVEAH